jgi:predicted RNA binding protein YcfA (HicA-like mRNA interferase family)
MPKLGPMRRRELIKGLRQAGFTGPFSGGKHQFMVKENLRVRIPNPHKEDIGMSLLTRILKEADIDKEMWKKMN